MKRFLNALIWGFLFLLAGRTSYAQLSPNRVDFRVTYDAVSNRYTAYVVPRYTSVNSSGNPTAELGATAQFTLKVPASFSISAIADVLGDWDNEPLRLGPGNPDQDWSGSGLDPAINYYIIGKSPQQTNYGLFTAGVPVPLFTFQGNGCFGPISPLPPGDPFIAAASENILSLNAGNSFNSRSGQPTGGNQASLEQFDGISGPPAQCAAPQANPDSQTLTAGIPAIIPVLANDTRYGQPVSNTAVTIAVGTPSSGTATVNPDGTVSYSPAAGYTGPVSFSYTLCDVQQLTLCSSASINLTVAPGAIQPADLLITKQVSQSLAAIGSTVSFTVTVQNLGPNSAVNVTALDTLARNGSVLLLGIPIASKGSYNTTTGIWTIGDLAMGEAATLVLTVTVQAEGVVINTASVTATGSQDPNAANNEASTCATVPVKLCAGDEFIVSVPAQYQNVTWFRDGSVFASGTSATITQSGVYTVTSTNGVCPITGCCPIIVEAGDCCRTDICVPFTITKIRSAR